jgi:hypothetical protein
VITEWPWSAALGERWSVFPPITPPDQKWPGIKFFDTYEEALAYSSSAR